MRRHALWLCLGMAPSAALALPSEPPQVVVRGTVTTDSGEHPAWLTLICTQGTGAALSLQLALGIDAAPDFPFDAYEGPRAPASYQPSAHLQVGKQRFAPINVAGWRNGEIDGAFVFGIAATLGQRNTATTVAAALGKPGVTLTWVQISGNLQTPPLAAQFAPDAAQSKALEKVAIPCLPGYRHK